MLAPAVFHTQLVLWDGAGLAVKRVEHVRAADPPRLRLKSTNPDYDDYIGDPEEAQIVGKVLWTVRWGNRQNEKLPPAMCNPLASLPIFV